jgi:hypothetical protein
MKILIGILKSKENEFDICIEKLKAQSYSNFEFFVIENMPNKLAHNELYSRFMGSSADCDFFLKLDADMVFVEEGSLNKMISYFNKSTENIMFYVNDIPSSLKIESTYFNSLIDECYNLNDGYQKLKVNSMIGSFKPSKKTNYRTLFIGTDLNTIYYHYLRSKGSFIDTFVINGLAYYQVLEKRNHKTKNQKRQYMIWFGN